MSAKLPLTADPATVMRTEMYRQMLRADAAWFALEVANRKLARVLTLAETWEPRRAAAVRWIVEGDR